jgi:hypothetical protein
MTFIKAHPVWSIVVLTLCLLAAAIAAFAGAKRISPVSWGWYGQVEARDGVALGGYDPVAYHRSGVAAKGDPRYATDWHGARWLFATPQSKVLFEADHEKYAPQFGGFCAYAASKGFTAKTEPTAWRIEQGKLYLFNDASVRDEWISELQQGVIGRGEKAWAARRSQ